MQTHLTFDVAVVGAGVFGAWTAYKLQQTGANVILLDAYGPGNSRASSGGESRIIRIGYGPDEIYSRYAQRSLALWQQIFERIQPPELPLSQRLFRPTGVLWMARAVDTYCEATLNTLRQLGVRVERLELDELRKRYSQIDFAEVAWGILEPASGALLARRAVQAVTAQAETEGVTFRIEAVLAPTPCGRVNSVSTSEGTRIVAAKYIFACGPWLPKLFPEILSDLIHVTRQEVFFFGPPAGDDRFSSEKMPVCVDFNDMVYVIPNLDRRGVKLAIDDHGPTFDPDVGERVITQSGLSDVRNYLKKRIPVLSNAPLTESRVCQYENTSNGDFLIDRHPDFENVWLVGGGSGHGFKHGPAVGEYVASLISSGHEPEARFGLSTKGRVQQRQVY